MRRMASASMGRRRQHTANGPDPDLSREGEVARIVVQEREFVIPAYERQKTLPRLERPLEIPDGEIAIQQPGRNARQFERRDERLAWFAVQPLQQRTCLLGVTGTS